LNSEHVNILLCAHGCFWSHLTFQFSLSWLVYRFFWIRAGMMGWLLINLSVATKQYIDQGSLSLSMTLFQIFCAVWFYCACTFWCTMLVKSLFLIWSLMLVKSLFLNLYSLVWQIYVLDYFWHEEYMTSTWVYPPCIVRNVWRQSLGSLRFPWPNRRSFRVISCCWVALLLALTIVTNQM
jgi:hypothetical protein